MITLVELINKYKPYDISDVDIIKAYFVENHAEVVALKLLNELAQDKLKELYIDRIETRKDIFASGVVLHNKLKQKEVARFYALETTFLFERDLDDNELKEALELYNKCEEKQKIAYCYGAFADYLLSKTKGKELDDFSRKRLESVIKRRNG